VVVSDGLGLFIEPELLLLGVLSPSLQPHVGVSVHLSNSVEWKFRDNVEWSANMESEFFIESLGFKLISFVKIDNLPSLLDAIGIVLYCDFFSFLVLCSCQDSLVVLEVDEFRSTVLKQLPPS
jgi:hypothetical protein